LSLSPGSTMLSFMHRALLILAVSAFAPTASGDIYTWVDETGRVQFSDRAGDGSTPVHSKSISVHSAKGASASSSEDDEAQANLGPYEAFEIASPEPNATLRPAEPNIPISLLIDPPLEHDHQIQIDLDGSTIGVDRSYGTQLSLTGLTLGTHVVRARVIAASGEVIAETSPVTFHVRKPLPKESLP